MIIGNIKEYTQNSFITENNKLKEALDYIASNNYVSEENEKDYFSDNCFAFINKINTRNFDNRFEAHKKHLDIFYCIEGNEEVYVVPTSNANVIKEYSEEKDIMFLEGKPTNKIKLSKGDYIILFPEDSHAPGIGDGSYLEKLVIKVKI